MKKTIILTGILLLTLSVSAFEIGQEQKTMAREIAKTIQTTCENELQQIDKKIRKRNIKKIKSILRNSIGCFITNLELVGEEYRSYSFYYYDAEKIAQELEIQQLKTFLENDKEALAEIADYAVSELFAKKPENDFEILITIGVNPIEAAIRTNHEDYIQSALETGEINYICFKYHRTKNYRKDRYSQYATITVNTDEEEINTIKENLSCRKSDIINYERI